MMSESMVIKEEVFFKANADKVWDLLTNPEKTKLYMFGCEVISNWRVGEPILWKGKAEDGQEIIYVKGEILEIEKGRKVVFSMFDPNMGITDIPKNYVNLCYEIGARENGTLLTLIQGDFNGVDNAKQRFEESKKGWSMVIPLMKKMLE